MIRITLEIDPVLTKLSTVIGAVENSIGVRIINTEEVAAVAETPLASRFVGGKKNKGIQGVDLITQILSDGKWKQKDFIKNEFVKRDFAPSSSASMLSKMSSDNKIIIAGQMVRLK